MNVDDVVKIAADHVALPPECAIQTNELGQQAIGFSSHWGFETVAVLFAVLSDEIPLRCWVKSSISDLEGDSFGSAADAISRIECIVNTHVEMETRWI
ncbi:MAG: hypothetical protein AAGA94_19390 [Pseudomonadota bacterium]